MSSRQRWRELVARCENVIGAIERQGGEVPPSMAREYALAVDTVRANREALDGNLGILPIVAVVGWGIGLASTAYAGFVLSRAAGEVTQSLTEGTRQVIAHASRAAGWATYALVGLGVYMAARKTLAA